MIRIRYGKIHVGALNAEAGLHVGNNFVGGRVHHDKTSEAVGSLGGTQNAVSGSRIVIVDDDIVDAGRIQNTQRPPQES